MKKYEAVDLDVVLFETEDVLTTSGETCDKDCSLDCSKDCPSDGCGTYHDCGCNR